MFTNPKRSNSSNRFRLSRTRPVMGDFLKRFGREEDGVFVVFALFMFLLILIIGGIGIDLMRVERDRASLQYTLDRAVLAAADLDQELSPQDVVADYFNKAGLSDYLSSVTVTEGLGFRVVTGEATANVRTQFMHMTGVDSFNVPANSTAEERVDGVEISLVLDVSGSMGRNNRLDNLKVAARDFIDEMVENTETGKLSISIIPYATQVSVPDELFNEFNVSQEHDYSNCINFEGSEYFQTSMSTSTPYQRTMYFDPWYKHDTRASEDDLRLPVCEGKAAREILVMENDADELKGFITGLEAGGNTSIDIGMKWGAALIDPSLNPVIVSMVDGGSVNPAFAARPSVYNDSETLKVIVLMTDGQNTSQYYVNGGYREGDTNIWWNSTIDQYSIYDPESEEYYWPTNRISGAPASWEDHINGDGSGETGSSVQLTFPELWRYTSLKYNLFENYRPWMSASQANYEWYYDVFDAVGSSVKNSQTKNICDATKDQQVIVFTIGFEAPANGVAVLLDCASSPAHFFDVDGVEISDAFSSIASSIRKLRLTQ